MYMLCYLIFNIVMLLLFLICYNLSNCNCIIISYTTTVIIKEVLFVISAFEFVIGC